MFSSVYDYFLIGEAVIPHLAIVFLMSSVETSDESKEIFNQFEIELMLYVFTPFSDLEAAILEDFFNLYSKTRFMNKSIG
jgi:hypothetical protein